MFSSRLAEPDNLQIPEAAANAASAYRGGIMGIEAAQQVNKENRYNPDYMRRKRARKINEAMTLYMQEPRSLSDTLIPGDAKSSKYEEVLVDNATESAEARAIRLERYAHLRAVMHAALTPREEHILLFRFESDLTLDQVGKKYGLSRERARQIEAEALGKLRRAMMTA